MRAPYLLLSVLVATACAARPVYYRSGGERWRLPLVAPLENRDLAVAATIDGHGPYLFLINPDVGQSVIDQGVAEEIGLYRRGYQRVLDQNDHTVPRRSYEVRSIEIRGSAAYRPSSLAPVTQRAGHLRSLQTADAPSLAEAGDLRVGNVIMRAAPAGSMRFRDEEVAGILGSDLLSSTIVLDVDRDGGALGLALAGHEQVPAGAQRVDGRKYYGLILVPIRVGERAFTAAVAVGAQVSALWARKRPPATEPAARFDFVDDTGTAKRVTGAARADLAVDGIAATPVSLYTLWDQRLREDVLDGVVGQSWLSRFRVVVDRDRARLWVAPRDADLGARAAQRLARWGGRFAPCAARGCVALSQDGGTLHVARDAAAGAGAYEVVLEPLDAAGRPLATSLLRVTLPRAAATVDADVAALGAASFRVVDLSPFTAACAGEGCALMFARSP
jgi:hypothetical protein